MSLKLYHSSDKREEDKGGREKKKKEKSRLISIPIYVSPFFYISWKIMKTKAICYCINHTHFIFLITEPYP